MASPSTYWFRIDDAVVHASCQGEYVADLIESVLSKYGHLAKTIFDVKWCTQDRQEEGAGSALVTVTRELKFQSRLADVVEDTELNPLELQFKERSMKSATSAQSHAQARPLAVAGSNQSVKLERELQEILAAAARLGLIIDEVCTKYSPDDDIFQKSNLRGNAEGARMDLISVAKSTFRDSYTAKGRRVDVARQPVDIQCS
jgi:hypothetical protein